MATGDKSNNIVAWAKDYNIGRILLSNCQSLYNYPTRCFGMGNFGASETGSCSDLMSLIYASLTLGIILDKLMPPYPMAA